MSAAGEERLSVAKLRRRCTGLCKGDEFGEVLLAVNFCYVAAAVKADSAGGKHLCLIGGKRRHQTVGGEEDWTVELRHLLSLVWPGSSVVSLEVRVLLESRVCVCGEHLAVGVDVNTCICGCFEEEL